VTADAPTLSTATNQNNTVNIFAVDHYAPTPDNLFYCAGFSGATNFGPINSINHAIPGNVINDGSNNISNPSGSFTITLTNLLSDGATSNLQVVTNGDTLEIDGLTNQPANGFAGVLLSAKDQTQSELQGISRIQIFHFEPGDELVITAPTGYATASGTTLTVAAPTYSPAVAGDTINYAWKYTTIYNGTPATISGKSGSVVAPALIPDLVWDVPVGQQQQYLWTVCEVDDGVTTFAAQGYFDGVFVTGNLGVYVPAILPCPTLPNNAALQALWTPPSSGKTIYGLIGDSITEALLDQMQDLCDTLFGAGAVLVANGGNPGIVTSQWFSDCPITGSSITWSQLPGESSRNNYQGMLHYIQANFDAGDRVVLNVMLGTNIGGTSYQTDIYTLLTSLATDYADIAVVGQTAPVVLHDMLYKFKQFNQVWATFATLEATYHLIDGLFSRGHLYGGTRKTREWFTTHRADMLSDGIHPNDTDGNDAVMRFWLEAALPAFAAAWESGSGGTVTVEQVGADAVLTWDADPTALHYLIFRSRTGLLGSFEPLATVDAPTTTYTDVAPPNGPEYYVVTPTPF
jgi:hypothetical protein